MRLIMNFGRTFTLNRRVVLGLTLSTVGCGGGGDDTDATEETDASSETTPATDLGEEEAGSNTGGGAETPATE